MNILSVFAASRLPVPQGRGGDENNKNEQLAVFYFTDIAVQALMSSEPGN